MKDAKTAEKAAKHNSITRILFVHPSDDLYGADVILLEIVKRLDRTRFEPIVVLPDDSAHIGLLSAELKSASIESIHLPLAILRRKYFSVRHIFPFAWRTVKGTLSLCRLIRKRDIRLVHSSTLAVFSGSIAAKLTGRKHLWHVHEILIRPRVVRKAMHFLLRYTADKVVCVSGPVRDHIAKDQKFDSDKLCVLHNGIELPVYSRTEADLRSELGIVPDLPVVGMIGRVSTWKGQEVLAQAAAILMAKGLKVQFVAIGGVFDGNQEPMEKLRTLVRGLGIQEIFKLQDFKRDAREFLRVFDVFVLPSTLPDPFPTVVLEAMSAAKPVIATSFGGPLEMVLTRERDGKETGLLVPPGDAHALSAAIHELLGDRVRREKMGSSGLERMREHFEVSAYVSRVMKIYKSMVYLK